MSPTLCKLVKGCVHPPQDTVSRVLDALARLGEFLR